MARKKKKKEEESVVADIGDFAKQLKMDMKKEMGDDAIFSIGDDIPNDVKRWVTSSLEVLDWICSGRPNGGYGEGKLIEISGPESIGKSHLAYQITRNIQKLGGITFYIDTESTAARENMAALGVDISDPKVLIAGADNLEEVFDKIENFSKKVVAYKGDAPICVVWDSVGGIGSIHDIEKEYTDAQQPGVAAKAIKRGLRRLRNGLGWGRILFIVINQQYAKIGAERWEKQTTTGGGAGLRYAADVRIELSPVGGVKAYVYPDDMEHKEAMKQDIPPIGIKVKAKTIKNRLTAPFRSCEFEIHFGVGLRDHHQRWRLLVDNEPVSLPDGREVQFGNAQWKSISVFDTDGLEIMSDKFRKGDIRAKMDEHAELITECINVIMEGKMKTRRDGIENDPNADIDGGSFAEAQALRDMEGESMDDAFKEIE